MQIEIESFYHSATLTVMSDSHFLSNTIELFHNYQNTKLTELAITSYLVFAVLNLLQSLINLVVHAS